MKYNLSEIMKRAWEIKKKDGRNIEKAAEANSHDNGYHYNVYISNWENYRKSRTYFAIFETRENSKHNKKISYGYYDNQKSVYIPEKYNNLEKNFTVGGAMM